jgi:hypothetical protein
LIVNRKAPGESCVAIRRGDPGRSPWRRSRVLEPAQPRYVERSAVLADRREDFVAAAAIIWMALVIDVPGLSSSAPEITTGSCPGCS